ncbi:MAG: TMEM165/GDT1 family protein [Pseudanabaena sp. CAN_BIN31]|nr:TMEM165/GDT1 family protein [Pseudanabaena sp. CAN_BIN31]
MMSVNPEPKTQKLEQAQVQTTLPVKAQTKSEHWQIVITTFITVFLAELGDKTQLSVLMISAQSHQPWIVFAGAAIALVSTSLLGVIAGKWLAKTFSPSLLNTLAGLSFLILSLSLLWEAII